MFNGIIESFQRDAGMTMKQFKKTPSAYELAQKITQQVQNSYIVNDFRHIASKIKQDNLDEYLIGPTGHK